MGDLKGPCPTGRRGFNIENMENLSNIGSLTTQTILNQLFHLSRSRGHLSSVSRKLMSAILPATDRLQHSLRHSQQHLPLIGIIL